MACLDYPLCCAFVAKKNQKKPPNWDGAWLQCAYSVCSGNKCMVTMSSCSGPELFESLVEAPTPSSVSQTILFICAACVYLIINTHLCECFTDFYMLILNRPASHCRQRKHLFLLFSNPIEMDLGVSHKIEYWMKVFCAISLTKYLGPLEPSVELRSYFSDISSLFSCTSGPLSLKSQFKSATTRHFLGHVLHSLDATC